MASRSAVEILRLALLYAALAALWYVSQPRWWCVAVGGAVIGVGCAIRIWASGHLFKTEKLITSGPYRYTRNPLYFGRFLLLTGIGVLAYIPPGWNLALLAVGYLVFFGYYMPRKERIEPARLEALHGDAYRAYHAAVPALFPRLTPWGNDAGVWMWERYQRNRETYTVVGLAVLVALFAWKAARFGN